ncbi:hypothetical protein [Paludisphaera borealis]|uniref:Uncharacterized protein n=1 Tax=Paludisphaera borealis TaxID=1387353 RepID=A0A1U7CZ80_9BACT|nr:hypothetical protein [Paludisphaera borealis]APW64179.1 hypothetical protein BSF38_05771 [Paludisphaera borealis]
MYGVPPDLPLARFLGKECSQIRIGGSEIQFAFPSAGEILVEGDWKVLDATGTTIDRAKEHDSRTSYCVHKIINSPVLRYAVDSPSSFTLHFENGCALTIFDSSEQYESFSIQPDGIYV